jgi:hypothetical protein
MTRKHFQVIAELLVESRQYISSDKKYGEMCRIWADELANHNSAFNRYTFLKACGVVS